MIIGNHVFDADTQQPIQGAQVEVKTLLQGAKGNTDANGFVSFTLPYTSYITTVTKAGYEPGEGLLYVPHACIVPDVYQLEPE